MRGFRKSGFAPFLYTQGPFSAALMNARLRSEQGLLACLSRQYPPPSSSSAEIVWWVQAALLSSSHPVCRFCQVENHDP
jgi:hypothetical protein